LRRPYCDDPLGWVLAAGFVDGDDIEEAELPGADDADVLLVSGVAVVPLEDVADPLLDALADDGDGVLVDELEADGDGVLLDALDDGMLLDALGDGVLLDALGVVVVDVALLL